MTAHPDDEAGAFGAALLFSADRGACTSVFCLTEGAAGSYREAGQTDAELARLRRSEFAAACEALKVEQSTLLSYPDGGLWQEPFLPLVGVLVKALRRFRPHVVLTFGGEGGVNLHRDHTIISLATTAAFHWAGRSSFFPEQLAELQPWAPQKLYYAATQAISTADEEAQRSGTLPPVSLSYTLGPLKERKLAAFAKHASQRGVLERVQSQFSELMNEENYLLVASRKPQARDEDRDIWDGVEAED